MEVRKSDQISDNDWEALLDPAKIAKAQDEGTKKFGHLTKEQWHKLRVRCKRDLFFLSYGVLQYTRLSTNLHGHVCDSMWRWRHERFREWLLPRNHFKSTLITISDSIRIVLPYTEEDRAYDDEADSDPLPWPDSLGPDCRLLIAHETHESASRYLFSIVSHFTSNPVLMGLFPDAVPSPRIHRINKHELQLPRNRIWNEPTIDTMGVGAKGQGRHYNFLKLDDLIGDKARDSNAEMEAAKLWLDNIQAFFSTFMKDRLDLIGTRWSTDDIYEHMEERYGNTLKVYRRPVEELNEDTGLKEPIFPEEVTVDSLNILRKNKKVFSAQYENDPDSGNSKFDESWLRYYAWQNDSTITVFGNKQGRQRIHLGDLNVCILFDPAVSGNAGIVVTGTDEIERNFVLEARQEEWTPSQAVSLLFRLVTKWHPRTVAIEEVLFSELYRHWIEREMIFRGQRFHITPCPARQKAKDWRVDKLDTYFGAGKILFNEKYYTKTQDRLGKDSDIIHQYKKYGTIKQIHLLDALAYGPEVWMPGFPRERWEQIKRDSEEQLSNMDTETGYSKIS